MAVFEKYRWKKLEISMMRCVIRRAIDNMMPMQTPDDDDTNDDGQLTTT